MPKGHLLNSIIKKDDEYYTQLKDIENELQHYLECFIDKVVFLPCDNPSFSNFWKYFVDNFKKLNLKELHATYIEMGGGCSYHWIYDGDKIKKFPLNGNGDFRSDECIEILKNCDIVVTNPPFSIFIEFFSWIIDQNKDFLILGSQTKVASGKVWEFVKDKKVFSGINYGTMCFTTPIKQELKSLSNIVWFQNLKKNERCITSRTLFDEIKYEKFVNYDAINVNRIKDIPCDYGGIMGVPLTIFLYNLDEYDIIGIGVGNRCQYTNNKKMEILKNGKPTGKFTFNAKQSLYVKYNSEKHKNATFKDLESKELYYQPFTRVLIRKR